MMAEKHQLCDLPEKQVHLSASFSSSSPPGLSLSSASLMMSEYG